MLIDWTKVGKRVSFAGENPGERRYGTIENFNGSGMVFVRETIFQRTRISPKVVLHKLQAEDLTEVTSSLTHD